MRTVPWMYLRSQYFFSIARRTSAPSQRRLLSRAPLLHKPGSDQLDETVSSIAEQYAIAKDELEIAAEETAKNTVYAREDRDTARQEVKRLEEMYEAAVAAEGEEVQKRIGQRIREIKSAIESLHGPEGGS